MRVQTIIAYLPVPKNIKLFYERVTASRLTCLFFAVAILHCVLQVSFQSWAFSINDRAARFLNDIVNTAGIGNDYALLVQGGELRLCGPGDAGKDITECNVAWEGRKTNGTSNEYPDPPLSTSTSTSSAPRTVTTTVFRAPLQSNVVGDDDNNNNGGDKGATAPTAVPTLVGNAGGTSRKRAHLQALLSDDEIVGVVIPDMKNTTGPGPVNLSLKCAQMIVWPNQIIHNTKREDVMFMAFQCWVLIMSVVAILNESIPHIIAALLTHVLATAWSVYQFFGTASFRQEFVRTTINSGRCEGVNLLPGYWSDRHAAEIAVVTVNAFSLLLTSFLSWRLIKMFGWQTFKRIGASLEINRVYMLVLVFSIGLQLAFFFVIAFMSLWVDFLINTPLGRRADHHSLYELLGIVTCFIMIPWLILGWFPVRRETKSWMLCFLSVCVLLLVGWGVLFVCKTFRWTFRDWRFFAAIATAASALVLSTTLLGIVCFFNFGKGLARFLNGQEPLSDDNEPDRPVSSTDIEKNETIGFPASGPIPTYTLAYGMMHNKEPLDPVPEYSQSTISGISKPPRHPSLSLAETLTRVDSVNSSRSTASLKSNPFSLERSLSNGSQRTNGSTNPGSRSYASAGSHHVPTTTTKKPSAESVTKRNWVIE